jgi:hypothetical protein
MNNYNFIILSLIVLTLGCSSSQNQNDSWVQSPELSGKYIFAKMYSGNYPDYALMDSVTQSISDTINAKRTPNIELFGKAPTINFAISQQDSIRCWLASVDGKLVIKVFSKQFLPGKYFLDFGYSRLQPGMYVVAIKSENNIIERRTIIIK